MSVPDGWRPRLVALDIDGTILKWVEGAGTTHVEVSPAVKDAVRRALDAGAHVVLASGRSPHAPRGAVSVSHSPHFSAIPPQNGQ